MLPCTCPKLLGRNGEKECAQPQSTRQRACADDLLVDEVDFPQGTTRKVNTRLRAHQRSAAGLEHAFGALCGLGVQGAGWLVQQQHRRLERDADGQRHALRLPALRAQPGAAVGRWAPRSGAGRRSRAPGGSRRRRPTRCPPSQMQRGGPGRLGAQPQGRRPGRSQPQAPCQPGRLPELQDKSLRPAANRADGRSCTTSP